ncbi:MAG: ABC transporter ATP-binding protein [Trueperaceae bacterium]|nr:ABC transporter ATP-binding protein [Trueperaceae bacterium]
MSSQANETTQKDWSKAKSVLKVRDLRIHYDTPKGAVIAVAGISFNLYEGETLGLVGESGCGKSTTAYGILQLIQPPGHIVGGEIQLDDRNLMGLSEREFRRLRWTKLALIPQGAMNSLNPTMKVHQQIADVITTHEGRQPKEKMRKRILELFKTVGLPARIYDMYPHELSGGMKQRVCIAMGIALNPSVVIADESTSALDVVVQRVVAQTLLKVKEMLGVAMIMIGHDMGLMAQMVDRIAVMYAGKIVEIASVQSLFKEPMHPYSQVLIESIPSLKEKKPLKITEGITHDPRNPPPGCIFQLRCPFVMEKCKTQEPPLRELKPRQEVACHLYEVSETGEVKNVAASA